MTDSRHAPRKRRQERAERRTANKQAHWEGRFATVATPLDLVQQNIELLRHRIKQFERKAVRRVEQARTTGERTAAAEKLVEARQEIQQICVSAATELAQLADQITTEGR